MKVKKPPPGRKRNAIDPNQNEFGIIWQIAEYPFRLRAGDVLRLTDRIIALLTQGTVPWHKSWKVRTGLPRNLISQKPYRGINVFLLLAMSYESPLWLTFRQVSQLGGSVKKGEKACPVVFWKQMKIEDKESGEQQKIPLLRYYHVFNVAQCDGLKTDASGRREAGCAVGSPFSIQS